MVPLLLIKPESVLGLLIVNETGDLFSISIVSSALVRDRFTLLKIVSPSKDFFPRVALHN